MNPRLASIELLGLLLLLGCSTNINVGLNAATVVQTPTSEENEVTEQGVMENTMEELRDQLYSDDEDISAEAVAELARRGKEATPILIDALQHSNAHTRRFAAEGLNEIVDPASADALFEATKDTSGEVRARAATALYRLGDARAVPALVATINDFPDDLHHPYTVSMYALAYANADALPLLIPLLSSPDELTRERAFLVLEAIVTHLPETPDWDTLWRSLGSYDPKGPEAERTTAVQQWQAWLAQR